MFSESCGRSASYDGLVEVYSWLVSPDDACVFGVVGLYCSTVTNAITPVVDHSNFGHLVPAREDVWKLVDVFGGQMTGWDQFKFKLFQASYSV